MGNTVSNIAGWLIRFWGLLGLILVLVVTSEHGPGLTSDSITYVSVGRSLADGNGFYSFDQTPYYDWPPLLSISIAFFEKIGLPSVEAIRIINALLFGVMVFLVGVLFLKHIRLKILAFIGPIVVLLSPALFRIALYLLTDFIFAFSVFLFLIIFDRYMHQMKSGLFILSAAIAGSAILTRYIGVVVVLTGLVWILSRRSIPVRRRLRKSILFGAVALLPSAVWIVHNVVAHGTAWGQRPPSQSTMLTNALAAVQTIADWCIPPILPPWVRIGILFFGIILLAGGYYIVSRRDRRVHTPSIVGLSFLFFLFYIIVLVGVASATTIDTPDSRLLAPIFVPLIIIAIHAVDVVVIGLEKWISRRSLNLLIIAVVVLAGALTVYNILPRAKTVYSQGIGTFNKPRWRESELITYLSADRPEGVIYSNAPEAVYYYGGIPAQFAPRKHLYNSPESRANDLELFQESYASGAANFIAWFDFPERVYFYDIEELKRLFIVKEAAGFPDGRLYLIKKPPEEDDG